MHPIKVRPVNAVIIHQVIIQLVYLIMRRKKRSRLSLTVHNTPQKKLVTAKFILGMGQLVFSSSQI